jgi:Icc-related predicted phosphoesterase
MKHLDNIIANKFYSKLVIEGDLIQENAVGKTKDGVTVYYDFDVTEQELKNEEVTLSDNATAIYFMEDKIYEAAVYLPNNEGTGINEYESEDILKLIDDLIDDIGDIDEFYEEHPWASNFKEKE